MGILKPLFFYIFIIPGQHLQSPSAFTMHAKKELTIFRSVPVSFNAYSSGQLQMV